MEAVVRVPVVDDDARIRALLADVLADAGHAVAQAAGGAEALALAAAGPPDVILLDLLMPGMDGWDFVAAYAQTPGPHAPVVLLTAAAVGADGTVAGRPLPPVAATHPKPFELGDLLAAVRAARP